MNFAAIDIGSNAIRLLIMEADNSVSPTRFKKQSLIRVPIRLGGDVFKNGKVSSEKQKKLELALKSFILLSKVFDVIELRAYATSALREAENGSKIVESINKKLNLSIQLISGRKEAEIIHSNTFFNKVMDPKNNYLFVDVGGGSTEISLMQDGNIIKSESFMLGTVRILQNQDKKSEWRSMQKWVKKISEKYQIHALIGSGGNINKLLKMTRVKKEDISIAKSSLLDIYNELSALNIEQRIQKYNLNIDRADVIVPACNLFLQVLSCSNCNEVIVPKAGLADGIIKMMYNEQGVSKK